VRLLAEIQTSIQKAQAIKYEIGPQAYLRKQILRVLDQYNIVADESNADREFSGHHIDDNTSNTIIEQNCEHCQNKFSPDSLEFHQDFCDDQNPPVPMRTWLQRELVRSGDRPSPTQTIHGGKLLRIAQAAEPVKQPKAAILLPVSHKKPTISPGEPSRDQEDKFPSPRNTSSFQSSLKEDFVPAPSSTSTSDSWRACCEARPLAFHQPSWRIRRLASHMSAFHIAFRDLEFILHGDSPTVEWVEDFRQTFDECDDFLFDFQALQAGQEFDNRPAGLPKLPYKMGRYMYTDAEIDSLKERVDVQLDIMNARLDNIVL
jgi:hypothetical protein